MLVCTASPWNATGVIYMRIAVVGGGISGLAAARALHPQHEVTLFEAADRLGGHSHTIMVDAGDRLQPVDTGFIVFNERNYPCLTRLFAELGVPTDPSDMSFSASIDNGRLEYAGDSLATLFGQPANLLRPGHYRMLAHILRFNLQVKRLLKAGSLPDVSLGEFLLREGYSRAMREHYLMPMAAAIWSCPTSAMQAFPLQSLARFFDNHGLLNVWDRPAWRTVRGGSQEYVKKLAALLEGKVRLSTPITQVWRDADRVILRDKGARHHVFDQVIFATHADQTLGLLSDADETEHRLLGAFAYQRNRAILHTDRGLMPRRRRVWASWNYFATSTASGTREVAVTYWMNRLQNIPGETQYFVSLNPLHEPHPTSVLREIIYDHPVFDQAALRAQRELGALQGVRRSWFCGAWCGYGFHEDGLVSGLGVAQRLGSNWPTGQAHAA